MKVALIAALSAAVLGVGAVQAVDSIGWSSEPASPAASTTEDTTTTEGRTTGSVSGTGLGLPIAAAPARPWGGEVRLLERPGGGTIAEVELRPAREPAPVA
jgi:hypothetical protein